MHVEDIKLDIDIIKPQKKSLLNSLKNKQNNGRLVMSQCGPIHNKS